MVGGMTDPGYNPAYRSIDAEKVVATVEKLRQRIEERLGPCGLSRVAGELREVARECKVRVELIKRPNLLLRLGVAIVVAAAIALLVKITPLIDLSKTSPDNVYTLLQGVEAAMNILVLIGAALLFLFKFEERLKQRRSLAALHQLRTIAHVIDMHQLTKDPSATFGDLPPTASSPARTLSPHELLRYLDYSSELLSLTAKVAALYAQSLPDVVVAEVVSDIERMTASMSQKIWQKITIIESKLRSEAAPPALGPPAVPVMPSPTGNPPLASPVAAKSQSTA